MGNDARYLIEFPTKLLGASCRIECSVPLAKELPIEVMVVFKGFAGSTGGVLRLSELKALHKGLASLCESIGLLDQLPVGGDSHKLTWNSGIASAIVVKPAGEAARFVVTAGHFHREGDLGSVPLQELCDAIREVEECAQRALERVRPKASK